MPGEGPCDNDIAKQACPEGQKARQCPEKEKNRVSEISMPDRDDRNPYLEAEPRLRQAWEDG